MDPLGEVVDDISDENSGASGELEELVHRASDLGRRYFREIEWDRLISEAYSDAKENASHDEHGHVHSCGIDGASAEEADGADHDAGSPAVLSRHGGCGEGR